jgi:hypothetical protein
MRTTIPAVERFVAMQLRMVLDRTRELETAGIM